MQFYRKAQMSKNPFLHKIYKKLFEISTKKKGIEFSVDNEIGYGFYVGHPYGICIFLFVIGQSCMGCSLFLIHCITDPQLLSFRYNPFIIISVACVGMIKSKKEFFERNRNEKEYE